MAQRIRSSSSDWSWFAGKIAVAAVVLTVVACGWNPFPPNPGPTPTPEPTPTPWSCGLPYPGCHEVDPPQQCSAADAQCWHNPTQDPEHCEEAPACEAPPPELPEPQCVVFVDRGGALRPLGESCDCYFGHSWNPCEPPPAGECRFPQGVPNSDFTQGSTSVVLGTQVNAAMERVAVCPSGTDCNAGPSADVFFDSVTADLRSTGLCAGRHNETPPGATDEIAVATECTGWWEGYHIYNYGGGKVVWSPGAGRPKWKIDPKWCGQTPPPSGDCPLPHPDTDRMKFKTDERGNHMDTTWVTVGQPEYCHSIGMGCMPGTGEWPNCTPRGGCPVRPEGNPERSVCEAELCGQKWECNGEPYPPFKGNPAQTNCEGHWKTYCESAPTVAEGNR